jgi:hypothetical protein
MERNRTRGGTKQEDNEKTGRGKQEHKNKEEKERSEDEWNRKNKKKKTNTDRRYCSDAHRAGGVAVKFGSCFRKVITSYLVRVNACPDRPYTP